MTMTRAFDQLETAHLAESRSAVGSVVCVYWGRKEIWEKALPFLRSPVSKRLFIRRIKKRKAQFAAGSRR